MTRTEYYKHAIDSVLCAEMNAENKNSEKWRKKCRLIGSMGGRGTARTLSRTNSPQAGCSILVPPSHTNDYQLEISLSVYSTSSSLFVSIDLSQLQVCSLSIFDKLMLMRRSSNADVNKGHLERIIFVNHYTNAAASDPGRFGVSGKLVG